jgi:hypothetical protein
LPRGVEKMLVVVILDILTEKFDFVIPLVAISFDRSNDL